MLGRAHTTEELKEKLLNEQSIKTNFKKKFKQMKKQLIKHAKEFQAFDYGFMETILFDCIKIYYEFFKDPSNLYQDTTNEMNHWEESTKALKRCVEIIDKLENLTFADFEEQIKLKNEFYDLIRDNIDGWWD